MRKKIPTCINSDLVESVQDLKFKKRKENDFEMFGGFFDDYGK